VRRLRREDAGRSGSAPRPEAEVRFGEQSWEEMAIGFMDLAVDPKADMRSIFIPRPPAPPTRN